MKNSKGIVIKPKQVWKNIHSDTVEIVSVVVGRGVLLDNLTKCKMVALSETGATTLKTLITSHDGADLAAARAEGWEVWVEGMKEPDLDAITCVEVLGEPDLWYGSSRVAACPEYTYRYKLKEETPICPGCKKAWDHTMLFDDGNELKCPDCVAKVEQPEPIAADESCHVLTQLIIDVMPYEILENAYWEFDAMRKMSKSTERDAFKRVARMTISATVNHLLSSLK